MGDGERKKKSEVSRETGEEIVWRMTGVRKGEKGTRKGVRKEVIKMKRRKEGRRKLVSNERRLYV